MSLKIFRLQSIVYFAIITVLCLANKNKFFCISNKEIASFMRCYFNDIFGYTGYLLLIGIFVSFQTRWKIGGKHIIVFTLCCGFFWEYITPLYRKDTVSDVLDMAAYMFGSGLYWFVFGGCHLPYLHQGQNN